MVPLTWSAHHAEALDHQERGEPLRARPPARAAITAATTPTEAAEASLVLAWISQQLGDHAASADLIARARPLLSGVLGARADCLRGLTLCMTADHDRAIAVLTSAADRLADDPHWQANALVGVGVSAGYLHRFARADTAFTRAYALYTAQGEPERAATCLHNQGFVAAQAGDLPRALAHYDAAAVDERRHPEALVDRASALLAAGLTEEAGSALARAARLLGAAGRGPAFAEATLVHAHCLLRTGESAAAVSAARSAADLFAAQQRPGWRAAARAIELRARFAAAETGSAGALSVIARAESGGGVADREWAIVVAGDCDKAGMVTEAAELRLAAGRPDLVEHHRHAKDTTAVLRVLGWLARAHTAPTRRGVLAACRAGLRVVDEHAAALGVVELQAGASELAARLSEIGVGAASGPRGVFAWTERHRAAMARPRHAPPVELARALAALRSADPRDRPALEGRVRRLSLSSPAERLPDVDELSAALGPRVLLSFVVHNGQLSVVSVVGQRFRVHAMVDSRIVGDLAEALRTAAALAVRTGDGAAAEHAARRLDGVLFAPLRKLIGDRPLVVLPTRALAAVPWGALPTCSARPVEVAPSAAYWLRATRVAEPGGDAVWIAGPGLTHADREVRDLHRRHGGRLLTARHSTVDQTLAAIDGAGLVHIAAHGRHRGDVPLFSALILADGPLYGYDLDRLRAAPHRLVLSSCESARDLLGLTALLLRRGTRTVIASTLPVPDDRAADLMSTLHDHLRAGIAPAHALARAQAVHGHLGFVTFGAG
ncbi:CHAT domain-containing protein [Actinokineospora sp.]|uniref:CHAT domain-containing protein n=1 Tax=Actinokineospora sp. TaxID=1872133 RepID=UPI004037D916